MRVLTIGLDAGVLKPQSAVRTRLQAYGELVDQYTVVVPSPDNTEKIVGDRVTVYGSGGKTKVTQLFALKKKVTALLRAQQYDVISVQDTGYLAFLAWLLARRFKIGLEIQVHGWDTAQRLRGLLGKHVLRHANAVRIVSNRMKQWLVQSVGVGEDRITIIPILPEQETVTDRSSYGQQGETFTFLTVGRLVSIKNIKAQIAALQHLDNTMLQIVGDGPERARLATYAQLCGVDDRVFFLGTKTPTELNTLYATADCFVLSSKSEGWGMVVIEAALHGLPIVMTDVGCAGEVICDGESGLVVPVGDQSALTQAMMQMQTDQSLRERLGRGAQQPVAQLPSRAETLKLYKESWQRAMI